jgi:GntR family transcriptional regulator/MocR family aminotransferase
MRRTTSVPELLLLIDRKSATPLRAQLERELRAAIRAGRVRPLARLPSTRALAADLGVSRGLVVEAYDQLLAEGYLAARRGSATRVAARTVLVAPGPSPAPAESGPRSLHYDFRPGLPDLSAFPRRAWLAALRRAVTAASSTALGYPDPRGAGPLREALAAYLNRARGTVARAEHIVTCTGFTQGLRLVCQVLRAGGASGIAVEDPSHAEQRAIVAAAGLRPVPIAVDGGGLRVDRLVRVPVAAVLVTPAHQFPTGAVLAPERRAVLLEWASRRGTLIVEDDFDAEYRYDRVPVGTLQGLAPERVVYAGSASKTLAPALRLGWLLVPSALATAVARAKRGDDLGSPTLEQLAYAEFLERGELDRHLRRTRLVYRRRRDALVGALRAHVPEAQVHGVAAGLHLMIELRRQVDEQSIVQAAASASVGVYGVQAHRARPGAGPPALLLGYGALSEAAIAVGVERLAAAISTVVRRGAGATPRARPARLCKHRRRSPGLNPKPRGVES